MSPDVLSAEELCDVGSFLAASGTAVAGALSARVLAGGRSNVTLHLRDESGGSWVLRMPPRAGRTPSAHDVAREYRVTSALAGTGVPVPPPVALCQDETVIGCDFAVTEFVGGSALRSQDDLDGLSDEDLGSASTRLVEALAALHRVDHEGAGLAEFGSPGNYAARQVRRWTGQWDLVAPKSRDIATAATELADRLHESLPDQRRNAVIHGDFRIDNALIEIGGHATNVSAVVDWELSTIGDPVADVATMCAYRHPAFDLVLGFPAAWSSPRLPSVDDLVRDYVAAGGSEIDNWQYHLALAYYKIAVIAAGIDHRHRAAGGLPGDDSAADAVEPFLHAGLDALLPAAVR